MSDQCELTFSDSPDSNTVVINARCAVRREGEVCLLCVAGLPMHHWAVGDRMAESYAMISVVRCGYAQQNEVARAFGCTTRTVRNYERRFESGGLASLARPSGRPQETEATNPYVRTAALLSKSGRGFRSIASQLKVSKSTIGRWLTHADPCAEDSPQPTPVTDHPAKTKSSATKNVQGVSLDKDPANRILDRLLARMGKLDDAIPLFCPGKKIPRAGVLLAVPALVQSGIFSIAEEIFGSIGPAFYGLRTTILALLLMGLLRIKRPEGLKEHGPADLGRLLGLDRAPEVKTLRGKLTDLADCQKAELFGRKLAQKRVAQHGSMMGFLYLDGHVRIYHGKRRIPKTYSTRLRMALPATTDYWVNDKAGDPVFVVTAEFNEALTTMLPRILEEARCVVGPKRRITIVFDRGGWSPKLFLKLIRAGFDILTYRKGRWRAIALKAFVTCNQTIEGRKVSYILNDRNIRLLKGQLRLRQITRLSHGGHQTPVVTSRKDLTAVILAYRMFGRWRQENFFKYMLEEYALDALADYQEESEDPERLVPNPMRRKLGKQLASARTKLQKMEALYGEAAINNKERNRPTIRGFKIAHGKLGQQIQEARNKIAVLEKQHHQTPERIQVKEMSGEPLVRLFRERKRLTNAIKMVAYQAESDLLALLRPNYARADQEGRTLVTTALQSPADLELGSDELRVLLLPLSSEHRNKAIAAMCEKLNEMNVCYPGTKLRMWFGVTPVLK